VRLTNCRSRCHNFTWNAFHILPFACLEIPLSSRVTPKDLASGGHKSFLQSSVHPVLRNGTSDHRNFMLIMILVLLSVFVTEVLYSKQQTTFTPIQNNWKSGKKLQIRHRRYFFVWSVFRVGSPAEQKCPRSCRSGRALWLRERIALFLCVLKKGGGGERNAVNCSVYNHAWNVLSADCYEICCKKPFFIYWHESCRSEVIVLDCFCFKT
jgi:hypothetical protein